LLCRNLIIKYTITNDSAILNKIMTNVVQIQKNERELIEILLSKLVKHELANL
jgi:hypothetical protein